MGADFVEIIISLRMKGWELVIKNRLLKIKLTIKIVNVRGESKFGL